MTQCYSENQIRNLYTDFKNLKKYVEKLAFFDRWFGIIPFDFPEFDPALHYFFQREKTRSDELSHPLKLDHLAAGEPRVRSLMQFFQVSQSIHCKLVRVELTGRIELLDVKGDFLSRIGDLLWIHVSHQLIRLQNPIHHFVHRCLLNSRDSDPSP